MVSVWDLAQGAQDADSDLQPSVTDNNDGTYDVSWRICKVASPHPLFGKRTVLFIGCFFSQSSRRAGEVQFFPWWRSFFLLGAGGGDLGLKVALWSRENVED